MLPLPTSTSRRGKLHRHVLHNVAECFHHFHIGQGIGGAKIYRSTQFFVCDQPFHRPTKIRLMNPGNKLSAVAHLSTEPKLRQSAQHGKYAVLVTTQNHGRPHCDLPGDWRLSFVQRFFPLGGNPDRKLVFGFGRAANVARFVPCRAEGMPEVDGCCAVRCACRFIVNEGLEQ